MKLLRLIYILGIVLLAISCDNEDNTDELTNCIPSGLANNIIAFYPFSNGSLNDNYGNNEHLINTTTASPTSDRNGNTNCAYQFNNLPNSSEFITTANTTFLNNLNEFSISLWYQPENSTRDGGIYEGLINRGLGGSCLERKGWSVGLYDCRKAVFTRTNSVWDNDITNFDCQQEVNNRTGIWSHLVVTYQQISIEMKIFRNGILQESSNGHANCGSGIPSYQDIGDLFLGKDYTGKIDDVIIFNKTLSQQDITSLFNMESCCE